MSITRKLASAGVAAAMAGVGRARGGNAGRGEERHRRGYGRPCARETAARAYRPERAVDGAPCPTARRSSSRARAAAATSTASGRIGLNVFCCLACR